MQKSQDTNSRICRAETATTSMRNKVIQAEQARVSGARTMSVAEVREELRKYIDKI